VQITWDENKRLENLKKHQLDFTDAKKVLKGPYRLFEDNRFEYEERRWIALGLLHVIVVVIVHTETEIEIRIISMRKATRHEQKIYFEEHP
jgi:uncharacterized DUF497 family protein